MVPAGSRVDDSTRLDCESLEPDDGHRWATRIIWARMLQRVFEIDMQHCPNCGGELKIVGAAPNTAVTEQSNPESQ